MQIEICIFDDEDAPVLDVVEKVRSSDPDDLQDALSAAYQQAEQWIWEQGAIEPGEDTDDPALDSAPFGQLPYWREIADRFYAAQRAQAIPQNFVAGASWTTVAREAQAAGHTLFLNTVAPGLYVDLWGRLYDHAGRLDSGYDLNQGDLLPDFYD